MRLSFICIFVSFSMTPLIFMALPLPFLKTSLNSSPVSAISSSLIFNFSPCFFHLSSRSCLCCISATIAAVSSVAPIIVFSSFWSPSLRLSLFLPLKEIVLSFSNASLTAIRLFSFSFFAFSSYFAICSVIFLLFSTSLSFLYFFFSPRILICCSISPPY